MISVIFIIPYTKIPYSDIRVETKRLYVVALNAAKGLKTNDSSLRSE